MTLLFVKWPQNLWRSQLSSKRKKRVKPRKYTSLTCRIHLKRIERNSLSNALHTQLYVCLKEFTEMLVFACIILLIYTSCTRNLKKFWNEGMSEGINPILKNRCWTSNLDVKKLQKLGCTAADNSIVITISTAFRTGKKRNCFWFRTGRPWGHRVWKFNYWSVTVVVRHKIRQKKRHEDSDSRLKL